MLTIEQRRKTTMMFDAETVCKENYTSSKLQLLYHDHHDHPDQDDDPDQVDADAGGEQAGHHADPPRGSPVHQVIQCE